MASTPSALSLTTITTYPTVDIDGHRYRLFPPDALPLFTRIDLEAQEIRLGAILTAMTRTEAEEQESSQLLESLCRTVLEAPAEVQDKLNDVQRMLIYEVFMKLPRVARQQVEALAAKTEPRRNGGKSLRGSRASTGATRSTGAHGSRSDSPVPV